MNDDVVKKSLEKVFDNMMNIILNGFSLEEHEEIKKAYYSYLEKNYFDTIKSSPANSIDKCIIVITNMEKSVWTNQSRDYKLSLLAHDDALDKLGSLSEMAYKYAIERFESNRISLAKEEAIKYIDEMKTLYEKVESFNKAIAYSYMSEGIVDFNYSCGNTDNYSMRIGRMTR